MMNILSPSILSADFSKLGEQIKEADQAGAQYIHIDVMDGMFVPSISYGMPVIKSVRGVTSKTFDVHLMIMDPIRYVKDFVDSGADIITFHLEAAQDPKAVIDEIHKHGKKPGTDASELEAYLDMVDMILVMTVEPGFGGQKLIPECVHKVKTVRGMLEAKNLKTDIEVDGGIYIENVSQLLAAGANVIVSGSGVFKGDIQYNVKHFLDILGN